MTDSEKNMATVLETLQGRIAALRTSAGYN
jgi:hypothetical protein